MPTDEIMAVEDEGLEIPNQEKRGSGALGAFALLLALAALAASGLLWWQERQADPEIDPARAARLDTLQRAQEVNAQEVQGLASRLQDIESRPGDGDQDALQSAMAAQAEASQALALEVENQRAYARSLQQAVEALQVRLTALEASLAALAPQRDAAPDRFDLASVEYLLRLAPERLALFHDLKSADEALALADARLAAMDNPLHIVLRQHIADARRELADTKLPNSVEISASLDALQRQVPRLAFADDDRGDDTDNAQATEAAANQGWWARLKASLASLVTVRRSAAEQALRLSLEDRDMLRQGLWMQLEAARLALMRQDQQAWADALGRASGVLERWFDPSRAEYGAVRQGLQDLLATDVSPDLPDISGPWAQLQLIRDLRVPPPAPPPSDSAPPSVAAPDDAETLPAGPNQETDGKAGVEPAAEADSGEGELDQSEADGSR